MKYQNMEALGRILYITCYYLFILASFVLLVAMIGAIVLTQEVGSEVGPLVKDKIFFFKQVGKTEGSIPFKDSGCCALDINPGALF